MSITLPVAFYTMVQDGSDIRLGHLWAVNKWEGDPPRWYGQPYPDMQEFYDSYRTTTVEFYPLQMDSESEREHSSSLLASVFQKLGVFDIKASSLKKLKYKAAIELHDYEMLYIPPSHFQLLKGREMPEFAGTGRWVIANAQHQACKGKFEISCDISAAAEYGIKLAERHSATLNHKQSTKSKVVYEFESPAPLAFGMTITQIMEKGGKWNKQGKDHEKIIFLHPV